MIVGLIIEAVVGAAIIVLGIIIWAKHKVSLIHEYQYQNVKEEDIPAYTRHIGIGLIIMGVGICATGALNMFSSPLWWIPLAAGILVGIIIMSVAQKKYNGSLFG